MATILAYIFVIRAPNTRTHTSRLWNNLEEYLFFCTCVCSFMFVVFLSFELLFQFSSSSSWNTQSTLWCILLSTSAKHISIAFSSHFCSSNNKGHGMLQRWSWYACYLNRFYLVEDERTNGTSERWKKSRSPISLLLCDVCVPVLSRIFIHLISCLCSFALSLDVRSFGVCFRRILFYFILSCSFFLSWYGVKTFCVLVTHFSACTTLRVLLFSDSKEEKKNNNNTGICFLGNEKSARANHYYLFPPKHVFCSGAGISEFVCI